MKNPISRPTRPLRTIRPMAPLSIACAGLFFSACMSTDPAEAEFSEAKVNAEVAGESMSSSFAQASSWHGFAAPALPAGLDLSARSALSFQGKVLPKRAGSTLDLAWQADLSDTAAGMVTLHAEGAGSAGSKHTLVAVWDAEAKDRVEGNEHIVRSLHTGVSLEGRAETLEISDADGNGIVTPVAGTDNRARILFTSQAAGSEETTELVVSAGPDADFDTEGDNRVHLAAWKRVEAGVTVGQGRLLDADGDGAVADNAKTSVALAEWFELNPASRPLAAKITAHAKLRILADKGGSEPVSFSFTEEMESGRTNSVTLRNSRGGAEITKGETLHVFLKTAVASGTDTLKHAALEIVMNPGQDLGSDTDDLAYAFHVKTEKRLGFERSAEFHFTSDAPIPHGQVPVSGTFSGKASYANGEEARLEGSFSPTGFQAIYSGPEGAKANIEIAKSK